MFIPISLVLLLSLVAGNAFPTVNLPDWLLPMTETIQRALNQFNQSNNESLKDHSKALLKLSQETHGEVKLLENGNLMFIKAIKSQLENKYQNQEELNKLIDSHIQVYREKASNIFYSMNAVQGWLNRRLIDLNTMTSNETTQEETIKTKELIDLVDNVVDNIHILSEQVVNESNNVKESKENSFKKLKNYLNDNSLSTETEKLVSVVERIDFL